jgi:acetyltransferase
VAPRLEGRLTLTTTETDTSTGLDALFLPASVSVIGATERPGTVGQSVLKNLLHPSFHGKVYAVNSRHSEICELKAYPSIGGIPEPVDLADHRFPP